VAFQVNGSPRGVLPVYTSSDPAHIGGDLALVALDFGTSSSTVLWLSAPHAEPVFVKHATDNLVMSCHLPSQGNAFPKSLVEGSLTVFSAWYENSTPSPLLGTLVVDRLDTQGTRLRASVIPRDPKMIAQLREEPTTRVYADLKWERLDRLEKDVLELYMRRVLLPAYSELAAAGTSRVHLAVTYPLAFDANRLAVMRSALEGALRSLESRTGISPDAISYFSESHAGMAAIEKVFAEYTLTVDMGGGTTDLSLLRGAGGAQICAAESVQIGGRDILRTLSKQQDPGALGQRLNKELGAPSGARLGVPAETLMETVLQSSGVNALIATVLPKQSIAVRQSGIALLAAVVS
jgi:hypothetical protein